MSSSVNKEEINKFSKNAHDWWNENGSFKPLHKSNNVRIDYIKQQIYTHYSIDNTKNNDSSALFKNISIIDVGCGGGLICEPMARMEANITGVDADSVAIEVATKHANKSNLKINYLNGSIEEIEEKFDVVLALEILEHVNNPNDFIKVCANLMKEGGIIIFSTLNRTPKSLIFGVVAAEYILRWIPKGTHSWGKFIQPSELVKYCRDAKLKPLNTSGLTFNILNGEFEMNEKNIAINYFLTAIK
ncbi:MAG: bifunctional 2-polyprenyl-6-hydroxyphenol methylase/3-demethylubiquinol 3-O-methyltransferase UbiG [Alphaproteobacteria bacterium]|nr:bifunctional 2-polyprenyl-6-hydroxyphenol methylase/3-demethylubiquinol 3-O-methyltransferase UbiG [Alphaproteobacteria bacterium]